MPATDDPVRVLLSAAQQGLLDYVGYTDRDLYEVRLGGVPRQLPSAEVLPMVKRLRAVQHLRDSGVAAELVEVSDDGGPFRLSSGDALHTIPADQVADWVDGYLAGDRYGTDLVHAHQAGGRPGDSPGAPESRFGAIRKVLDEPGISDQARMAILGLMYGDPQHGTSMEELAERVGRTKKTIIEALAFGGSLVPELADRMIEAFGRRWPRLTVDGIKNMTDTTGRPVPPPVDMPGIARLRMINEAERRGWLRYIGEPSPNRARWARSYQLAVGQASYTVPAESLVGWLAGLEAWHTQATVGGGQ